MSEPGSVPEDAIGGWRVLLVDDHEGCRKSYKRYLSRSERVGEVRTASRFDEALDAIREGAFDLVTLDLYMGVRGRDGVTFLQRLREMGHRGKVVILTSEESPEWFARAIFAGADDYWIKTSRPWPHELMEQLLDPVAAETSPVFARTGFLRTSGLANEDVELLAAWYDGFPSDAELALRLRTTEKKVNRRLTERIFRKLGVANRAQLARILTLCAFPTCP